MFKLFIDDSEIKLEEFTPELHTQFKALYHCYLHRRDSKRKHIGANELAGVAEYTIKMIMESGLPETTRFVLIATAVELGAGGDVVKLDVWGEGINGVPVEQIQKYVHCARIEK